jgi:hypothetical protein
VSDATDDFALMWEWFAGHCQDYSPLYGRISLAVAGDRPLLELLRAAPPSAHLPPALLAAVHYLIIGGTAHPLAEVYAGESDADPGPLFLDFCRSHRDEVMAVLAVRHIQTNECGRSAVIAPGLTWLASQLPGPFGLIDVGASAGLNLLCDRYRIEYGDLGATGPADSPVTIHCHVEGGRPPIAALLPPIVSRVGIDRSPIDLADPDDARWLLACVWPDTGRLERTGAAIRLAQADPPPVIRGDANEMLPQVLAGVPRGVVPVVVTTWAFAYFGVDDRREFMELLDRDSRDRAIAWLNAEGAGTVEAFAGQGRSDDEHGTADILGAVIFENGERRAQLFGYIHEHGNWIDWRAPPIAVAPVSV